MADLQVRLLRPADLSAVSPLFEAYPFKRAQRQAQRLDAVLLREFYLEGLRRSVQAGHAVWLASRGADPLALGALTPDAWHSKIYGMPMAKVTTWLNTIDPAAGQTLLETLLDHARAEGLRHLALRIDGEDFPNLHLAQGAGFRLVDVSLKFSRPMPVAEADAPALGPRWSLRPADPADGAWMRRLGGRHHERNHFLNDAGLPAELTHRLFEAWVERCLDGLAYRIDVIQEASGQGRGFITWLRNRAFESAIGRSPLILDYVILDPAVRGDGLGPRFIHESLRAQSGEGFDYCELRTSHTNHPAVACYEKLGFRLCASDFVLHLALEE